MFWRAAWRLVGALNVRPSGCKLKSYNEVYLGFLFRKIHNDLVGRAFKQHCSCGKLKIDSRLE